MSGLSDAVLRTARPSAESLGAFPACTISGLGDLGRIQNGLFDAAKITSMATNVFPETFLEQLDGRSATAANDCASQIPHLSFEPYQSGIEICKDDDVVRRVTAGLVACFSSKHWKVR